MIKMITLFARNYKNPPSELRCLELPILSKNLEEVCLEDIESDSFVKISSHDVKLRCQLRLPGRQDLELEFCVGSISGSQDFRRF